MAPNEHILRDMPADTTRPTPSSSHPSAKPQQNTHSAVIGFICVAVSISIMIGISELDPLLFAHRYQKPYFLIYLTQTTYTLMIIPWCILKLRSMRDQTSKPVMPRAAAVSMCELESSRLRCHSFSSYQSITINGSEFEALRLPPTAKLSQHLLCVSSKMRRFLLPAMSVSALVFTSNYLFFQALYYSIASVNNVLFQSQCVFVLFFSILFLGHRLTLSAALSVVLSVSGVAMIALLGDESEDDSAVDPSPIGVVFCLLSAVAFALFQVRMSAIEQKCFAQQTRAKLMDTLLFQALMGMSAFALAWPGMIVLDALQIEPFELPNVLECVALLFSTSMSMIYYGALLVGIAYKGALFMSTGVLLAIPAMFAVDMVVHGLVLTLFTVVGSLCIMIGFAVMQMKASR